MSSVQRTKARLYPANAQFWLPRFKFQISSIRCEVSPQTVQYNTSVDKKGPLTLSVTYWQPTRIQIGFRGDNGFCKRYSTVQ